MVEVKFRQTLPLVAGTLCVLASVTVVVLRATDVVTWPWVAVLAPFTAAGALFCALVAWHVSGPYVQALRSAGGAPVTPPPEQLGVPLAASMHLVVLWTRFMTHATYFAVKRECRARNVTWCYWVRTSPPSLLATIAEHAAAGPDGRESPTGNELHE